MSLRIGALYDALIAAHAPEDVARKASEEVAGYQERMASIDTRLAVLTWMVGILLAVALTTLTRVWQ